jgi:hypothetical protein
MFLDGEIADLKIIAAAWEVEVPQVIWAVMATWLSDRRGRDIMKLPYRLRAKRILRKARGRKKDIEDQRKADSSLAEPDEGPGGDLRRTLYGHDWENREGGGKRAGEVDPEPGV